jgi:glycosyltransferase involved in cell wall biosynthesis
VEQPGVVVIGRNEGERLERCLRSVLREAAAVVYVDSASTDGSAERARGLGAQVVALDLSTPFTAARARNAGYRRLREAAPGLRWVQFVDGDCELDPGWLAAGARFLEAQPRVAVAAGRLREKEPERSVYNLLCDLEWQAPAGESPSCGGVAMMRTAAFDAAGGFNEAMIAGEEPELCLRLRAAGWRIWRLADDMARHDAAMLRFGQWWRRALRGGYAFALGAALHGASHERHGVRESASIWLWGLALPLAAAGLALGWSPWAGALLAAYPLQVARLALRGERTPRENWWRAFFLVLGKFPEMLGQARFLAERLLGRQSRLIEHK